MSPTAPGLSALWAKAVLAAGASGMAVAANATAMTIRSRVTARHGVDAI
jgi:Na+/glutamate symporter